MTPILRGLEATPQADTRLQMPAATQFVIFLNLVLTRPRRFRYNGCTAARGGRHARKAKTCKQHQFKTTHATHTCEPNAIFPVTWRHTLPRASRNNCRS